MKRTTELQQKQIGVLKKKRASSEQPRTVISKTKAQEQIEDQKLQAAIKQNRPIGEMVEDAKEIYHENRKNVSYATSSIIKNKIQEIMLGQSACSQPSTFERINWVNPIMRAEHLIRSLQMGNGAVLYLRYLNKTLKN